MNYQLSIQAAALLAAFAITTVCCMLASTVQTLGIAIVFSVAALVLIIVTRGDLGYQRYQREVEAARGGRVR